MKTLFLVIVCLALAQSVCAFEGPQWHAGSIVLTNGEVLVGDLSLAPLQDVILYRSGHDTLVIHASRVQLARYYDELSDINRQFIALRPDSRESRFFEVVVQGPVKVIRYQITPIRPDEIDGYKYYIWDGMVLLPIKKFRSKVYPKLLEIDPYTVHGFVAREHLNLDEMLSAILIIQEYDQSSSARPLVTQNN